MERLTIPDEPIEGGMRRAVVDARAVREEAMNMYWRLKKYEDICPDPERLREIDALYLDKCREVTALKEQPRWIPVEKRLPDKPGDYWVAMRHLDGSVTTEKMFWRPDWPHEDAWNEVVIAWQPYYCPEPFVAQN